MGLCSWIIFGFLAGLLARAVFPGEQKMGLIATTLLGIGGSFAGGFVASLLTGGSWRQWNTVGFLGSILGAFLLLGIFELMGGKRRR